MRSPATRFFRLTVVLGCLAGPESQSAFGGDQALQRLLASVRDKYKLPGLAATYAIPSVVLCLRRAAHNGLATYQQICRMKA